MPHSPLGFHENARPAAKAAYAAQRQGKFWEMHDILFANQKALSTEFYLKTAQDLGLDLDQFQRDMDSDKAEIFIDNAAKIATSASAPITIVEFTDYECPFCSRGDNTIKELMKNNPGQIRLVHKNYPLPFHRNARLDHQAAIAAGKQGKFWEMHDLLFENQSNLDVEDLLNYANELGLDANELKAALDNETYKAEVDRDIALAPKLGIYRTPTFVINGKTFVGAHPVDYFTRILDDEVTKAALAAAATGKEKSNTAPTKLVKKVTDDRYEISREVVENIRKNPNSLKNNPQYGPMPQIQPIFKDGDISGIKLRSVQEGSIYSQLGLKTGDLIIAINGQVIKTPKQVMTLLDAFKPGQNLILQINRSGKEKTLPFQLK